MFSRRKIIKIVDRWILISFLSEREREKIKIIAIMIMFISASSDDFNRDKCNITRDHIIHTQVRDTS